MVSGRFRARPETARKPRKILGTPLNRYRNCQKLPETARGRFKPPTPVLHTSRCTSGSARATAERARAQRAAPPSGVSYFRTGWTSSWIRNKRRRKTCKPHFS
eukprot:14728151-Alexandrium_andersonii.AAC.1